MSGWIAKRFWSAAVPAQVEDGFTVLLDGRRVRTPAGAPLTLPTRTMAEALAEEWAAQEGAIRPATMPVTRSANAAIDKVGPQRDEVVVLLADYGGTDLLCYRAESPEALARRQADAWDPLLEWATDALGARLRPTRGIMPQPQEAVALGALRAPLAKASDFELAALHDLVAITGSLVLGLAVSAGRLRAESAWDLSRIEEDWQIEHWGADDEAAETTEAKRADLLHASRFLGLSRDA